MGFRLQIILIAQTLLLTLSCGRTDYLELALEMSGNNRMELEKVLSHYEGDSLRSAAARFLIGHMIGKFTVDSASVRPNQKFYEAMIAYRTRNGGLGVTGLYDMCDSVKAADGIPTLYARYTQDLKFLSASDLVKHIDRAIALWKDAPWKSDVGFEEFCRFILPYRVYESHWKGATDYFNERYAPFVSLEDTDGYLGVGEKIKTDVSSGFMQDGTFFRENPFLSPTLFENTVKVQAGVCYDFNATVTTALRSVGIPATINTVPYWGNSNASHFWTEIIGAPAKERYDNTQRDFRTIEDELVNDTFWFKDGIITDTTGIPEEVFLRKCRTVPKVYRMNYEIQSASLSLQTREEVPMLFRNMTLEDITARLVVTQDVLVEVPKFDCDRKRFVYLCVYDPDNLSWVPVAWSKVRHARALFRDMGVNILYIAAFYHKGTVVPFGDPFILTASGERRILRVDESRRQTVTLFSKVPLRTNFAYYAMLMRGDRFQFANKADLSDTVTVCRIDKIPYYTQEVDLQDCPPARYMIYRTAPFPIKFVAELAFIGEDENGKEITFSGKPFGNPCYSISPLGDAFDGNRETFAYFDKQDHAEDYIGLDLGKPRKIKKIRYCPRNDDNAVIPGEDYELYCWKEGWQSLGRQLGGTDRRLHYDNVPEGALLRIHNHTRGKENRPFTLEGGRQVWW